MDEVTPAAVLGGITTAGAGDRLKNMNKVGLLVAAPPEITVGACYGTTPDMYNLTAPIDSW